MGVREGRGPRRAPPDTPIERPHRAAAWLVLLAVLASASLLALRPGSGRGEPARAAPFEPGTLQGRRPSGTLARVATPAVVLYVDDACPFCAQELERWASAAGAVPAPRLPMVVVSPDSDPAGTHVPAPLRSEVLHDADGSIARALGVRGVPFRAVLDDGGTVVDVGAGLSRPRDIQRLLAAAPPPDPGDREAGR